MGRHGIFGFLASAVLRSSIYYVFKNFRTLTTTPAFVRLVWFLSVTNQGNEADSSAGFVNVTVSFHRATLFAAENVHPNHPSSDWPHLRSLYQLTVKSSIKRRALPS
jgi:hypothetical protein